MCDRFARAGTCLRRLGRLRNSHRELAATRDVVLLEIVHLQRDSIPCLAVTTKCSTLRVENSTDLARKQKIALRQR